MKHGSVFATHMYIPNVSDGSVPSLLSPVAVAKQTRVMGAPLVQLAPMAPATAGIVRGVK